MMRRFGYSIAGSLGLAACAGVIPGQPGADESDAAVASLDAAASTSDAGVDAAPVCPEGTTDLTLSLASSVAYPAAHLENNPAHYPFASICLPFTAAGQAYYLESKAIRSDCTAYDACETSLEIKCFDEADSQLQPQIWSGENFLEAAPTSNLFARMTFVSTAAGAVTCKTQFFNHDHGIAGGTITLLAGSTFKASELFGGAAATPDTGGGVRLSSATPAANLKPISGWHMPAGRNRVVYTADIQATECHSKYPSNASNPATQCTVAESGADSVVEYRAQAYEERTDGSTCHLTDGTTTTKSIDERTHHKMLYTQVRADHTPGCANVWHLQVQTRWKSGRSFMVQSGPYGQGMVWPL